MCRDVFVVFYLVLRVCVLVVAVGCLVSVLLFVLVVICDLALLVCR